MIRVSRAYIIVLVVLAFALGVGVGIVFSTVTATPECFATYLIADQCGFNI